MALILLIFIAVYVILIEWWRGALPSSPSLVSGALSSRKVSVVIAARNESGNILPLLYDLKQQTYSDFEVIVVDDHSSDGTFDLCRSFSDHFNRLRVLENDGEGKKSAVAMAVRVADGDFILTTDADCRVPQSWISTVVSEFDSAKADVLLSPVDMFDAEASAQSFFMRLQRLEFLSLQASAAGAACRSRAFMCNAANLAFRKELYAEASFSGSVRSSGDDVFFLHYVKSVGGRIASSFSPDAVVSTKPNATLCQFFSQRSRWAGKTSSYRDADALFVAFVVFLANVALLLSALLPFFSSVSASLFPVLFLVKIIADFHFLSSYAGAIGKSYVVTPVLTLALSVFYPFYVLVSAFGGFFNLSSWKGRKVS